MGRASLAAILCLALIGVVTPATAKSSRRVVSADYEVKQGSYGPEQPGVVVSSVTLPAGPENYVSIEIADKSGLPVQGKIVQAGAVATFCGTTGEPIRIDPGFPITVQIHDSKCFGGAVSAATGGVVKATYERLAFRPTESKAYAAGSSQAFGTDEPMPLVRAADVFFLAPGRKQIRVEITDTSGTSVAAKIVQGEWRSNLFCGSTPKPVKIDPGAAFEVILFSGECDGAPSIVTDGSVAATYLRG